MSKVIYSRSGRIARITLNRPEVFNAIDDEMPGALSTAGATANADTEVHVIVLSGAGKAISAGYDLSFYAEGDGADEVTQPMPWGPLKHYAFMRRNTEHFMSLWHSAKPVISKVQGYAVTSGSDIALCCDCEVIGENTKIGYMPARVWGCPTMARWVYRVGAEQAKRMLLTGDKIDGREAACMGLVMKAVPAADLDAAVEDLAAHMVIVPINQLTMQKMGINQAIEAMGLAQTQRLATVMDGIARHSPEGLAFNDRSEEIGWKQAVDERDRGTYAWSRERPINDPR